MFILLIITLVVLLLSFGTNGLPLEATIPQLDGRIIGGSITEIESYPYQMSLQLLNSHNCGGSLVSQKWVVTAAHCTHRTSSMYFTIRYGTSFINRGGNVISVKTVNTHPKYDSWTIDYDISLIELPKPLNMNSLVGVIGLPGSDTKISEGTLAIVTGWGTMTEGGFLSDQLQMVEVPLVSNEFCQEAYKDSLITDRMICAGYDDGGKDACQGDSGGPLVVEGKLVGVVSWGYGCARPKYPGVYSSVSNLREFITETAAL